MGARLAKSLAGPTTLAARLVASAENTTTSWVNACVGEREGGGEKEVLIPLLSHDGMKPRGSDRGKDATKEVVGNYPHQPVTRG